MQVPADAAPRCKQVVRLGWRAQHSTRHGSPRLGGGPLLRRRGGLACLGSRCCCGIRGLLCSIQLTLVRCQANGRDVGRCLRCAAPAQHQTLLHQYLDRDCMSSDTLTLNELEHLSRRYAEAPQQRCACTAQHSLLMSAVRRNPAKQGMLPCSWSTGASGTDTALHSRHGAHLL